jgi:hypothetical protein
VPCAHCYKSYLLATQFWNSNTRKSQNEGTAEGIMEDVGMKPTVPSLQRLHGLSLPLK